jgi:hypothetical protein
MLRGGVMGMRRGGGRSERRDRTDRNKAQRKDDGDKPHRTSGSWRQQGFRVIRGARIALSRGFIPAKEGYPGDR